MRWQLAGIQFCDDKHLLWRSTALIQLEPKQAEVLAYFCRNPGRMISRDEFIAQVWQGQIVTDNAINRIIAKLRKSLGDSAKHSEFIITLPRKGYRFIAPVKQLAAVDEMPPVATMLVTSRSSWHRAILGWLLLSVLTASAAVAWYRYSATPQAVYLLSEPLTREHAEEVLPALSPDGRWLIYSAYQGQWLRLYIKDLQSSQIWPLSHGESHAGNGDWSKDGRRFVYYQTTTDSCQLTLLEFSAVSMPKLISENTVHQCPAGSYGNVAFSHDVRKLIFSENSGPGTAYFIYLKDLASGEIYQPAQPAVFLAGNAEFDLHPSKEQLLIASPDEAQQLAYYVLDIEKNKLSYLFSKNQWLCCPIWNQQGNAILQTDSDPANNILQLSLSGKLQHKVYSAAHGIFKLKRVADGHSYVYSGASSNQQIRVKPTTADEPLTLITSSVSDSLPRVSNQQQQLAFVSERSGSREIWLHQLSSGENRKLSQLGRNDWIYDVQWSPDDSQLAVLLINTLKLINVDTGQVLTLPLPAQEIRGISWVTNSSLAFSLLVGQQWRLHHFHIGAQQLQIQPGRWAYASYDAQSQQALFIDQQQQLFLQQQLLTLQLPQQIDRQRRFYFSLSQGKLYFVQPTTGGNTEANRGVTTLWKLDIASGEQTKLMALSASQSFSVSEQGVYFTTRAAPEADIFRISELD
ncbi:winged helix-turn-helix domain-containing protein [Rheinheimera hassiensis]|uniref:winged helix-turn-helix domain-containing protein n=1 Tax=Rheinheimera hassiensis TaxID=1193627 RepID=UPI001F06E5B8|nr:winged helix-turn-helix domain-containing protein [Rheinheimera hassiensis]